MLRSIYDTGNSSQQMCLSIINTVFSDDDKILINIFAMKGDSLQTVRKRRVNFSRSLYSPEIQMADSYRSVHGKATTAIHVVVFCTKQKRKRNRPIGAKHIEFFAKLSSASW